MFASLQAFSRRVIAVCSFLCMALYGLTRWLLAALFGQWQPPFWLRKLWQGLCAVGRWLRARPKQTAATLAGLALLGAIGAYAWHWYKNLPVPHMVAYSVHAPDLTGYQNSPISVDTLRINFSESAAPLEAIEQKVERGVSLEPELKGSWHWASDRRLVFTPTDDWPIDQAYRVTMDQQQLLADGVLLKQYDFEFRSKAFSADLASRELLSGPSDPQPEKTGRHLHILPPDR
jgi:hypothetical protein